MKISTIQLEKFFKEVGVEYSFNEFSSEASCFAPLSEPQAGALIWCKSRHLSVNSDCCSIAIVGQGCEVESKDVAVFRVANPRLVYAKVVNQFYNDVTSDTPQFPDSLIKGDGCVIDARCRFGENVRLGANVVLEGIVEVGDNVVIASGAVIGSAGFGFVEDQDGRHLHFPHIGGVVIEDDVYIGANTCVDRAGLGKTVVGKGTKISNHCQIGHNAVIGANVVVTGRVQLGGGCTVGDNSYLGPGVIISNGIRVGVNTDVKIGSVVVNDVPDGGVVSGNFALPHKKNLMYFSKKKAGKL